MNTNKNNSIFEAENQPIQFNPLEAQSSPLGVPVSNYLHEGVGSLLTPIALEPSQLESVEGLGLNPIYTLEKKDLLLSSQSRDILSLNQDGLIVGNLQAGDSLINSAATVLTYKSQIIFIDAGVEDYQQIVAGINPFAEVILLDGNQDGIAQISQILSDRQNITSVHIMGVM